jgi:hypothetical protein
MLKETKAAILGGYRCWWRVFNVCIIPGRLAYYTIGISFLSAFLSRRLSLDNFIIYLYQL